MDLIVESNKVCDGLVCKEVERISERLKSESCNICNRNQLSSCFVTMGPNGLNKVSSHSNPKVEIILTIFFKLLNYHFDFYKIKKVQTNPLLFLSFFLFFCQTIKILSLVNHCKRLHHLHESNYTDHSPTAPTRDVV